MPTRILYASARLAGIALSGDVISDADLKAAGLDPKELIERGDAEATKDAPTPASDQA
jgi:hypothetical protein